MAPQNLDEQIAAFLAGSPHAVVGASTNRAKYGNKALRAYMQAGRRAIPVNPHETVVEGLNAYGALRDIPEPVHGISIITPPRVTEQIVREAIELGIRHMWMQPGAESDEAVAHARSHRASVIAGDACILVVLGYSERH